MGKVRLTKRKPRNRKPRNRKTHERKSSNRKPHNRNSRKRKTFRRNTKIMRKQIGGTNVIPILNLTSSTQDLTTASNSIFKTIFDMIIVLENWLNGVMTTTDRKTYSIIYPWVLNEKFKIPTVTMDFEDMGFREEPFFGISTYSITTPMKDKQIITMKKMINGLSLYRYMLVINRLDAITNMNVLYDLFNNIDNNIDDNVSGTYTITYNDEDSHNDEDSPKFNVTETSKNNLTVIGLTNFLNQLDGSPELSNISSLGNFPKFLTDIGFTSCNSDKDCYSITIPLDPPDADNKLSSEAAKLLKWMRYWQEMFEDDNNNKPIPNHVIKLTDGHYSEYNN